MKVRDTWHRWQELGAAARFVVFDEPETVRQVLLADLDVDALPFPVLVDAERDAYRCWGLIRARRSTFLLDPKLHLAYLRLLRSGERIRGVGRDDRQLGGDFLLAGDGTIAYARPQRRDDRPAVGELLRAAREAAGSTH